MVTQADIDAGWAAVAALAAGQQVVSVTFGGRTTQYQPARIGELREALTMLQAAVGASTTPRRPKQFLVYPAGKGI